MTDLLLPATDAGVLVQVVVLVVVTTGALYLTRHHRDLRILVIGIALLIAGVMAVRAIH